ncbi:MAG: bifunctional nuclease family protein [Chloroflexi bacterium]|nr:bifunctional nuclease family protein [Chloroflexota bacterium]
MIEMTIDSIRVSLMNYQRVVILKEKNADRYLPIWIGPAEADAIAVKLQDVSVPRPLTHDLLSKVIGDLGGSVSSIIVSDLQNDTFFAKIMLDANGSSITIDSRPSDALALAVRVNVPIFAEESVLSKAAIFLDKETGKTITAAETRLAEGRAGGKMDEEEIKRLSAFKDFIDTLDLSDLGKEERSKREGEDKDKDEGDSEK